MLRIISLGQTNIQFDDVALGHRKDIRRALLLIYLAETRQRQLRSHLAELLWPRCGLNLALNNLRTLLHKMRLEGYGEHLSIDRQAVSLNQHPPFYYDMDVLREQLMNVQRASLEELAALEHIYQGPFCAVSNLEEFPRLQEWSDAVQYGLEFHLAPAFIRLTRLRLENGNAKAAVSSGRHLAQIAPYDEQAQLLYLQALIEDQQVLMARRHLISYRALMAEEFPHVTLSPDFDQMAAQIVGPKRFSGGTLPLGREETPGSNDASRAATLAAAARVPYLTTQLVGRVREQELFRQFLDRGERLVTVVGLGGVGKTALIRSQLPLLQSRYQGGVHFIDLRRASVHESDAAQLLLAEIANAFKLAPKTNGLLEQQVLEALQGTPQALILDNFELFQAAAPLVQRMLDSAPLLSIFITSRSRLKLGHEIALPLRGLQVATLETGEECEAVRFFARCAQRVRPDFMLMSDNRSEVAQLCHQLGGLPLAIQLATQQLTFYSVAELLQATAHTLEVLTVEMEDLPAEHRSLSALFCSTFNTLTAAAQQTLAELSVFVNRWHRTTMQTVVPKEYAVYVELLNASLLQNEEPGWFSLHPLVRQFAARNLSDSARADVMERYAAYFLNKLDLGQRLVENRCNTENAVIQALRPCHADLMAAWQWAAKEGQWHWVERALISLIYYSIRTLQDNEGAAMLQWLLDRLPDPPLLTWQKRLTGLTLYGMGIIRHQQPDYTLEATYRRRGLDLLADADDPWNLTAAHMYHGHLMLSTGKLTDEAFHHLHHAAELAARHKFSTLQVQINGSLLYKPIFLGEWRELSRLSEELWQLFQQQPELATSNSLVILCQISMFLDRAHEADAWVTFWEQEVPARPHHPFMLRWVKIMRAEVMALHGNLARAVQGFQETIPWFVEQDIQNAHFICACMAVYQARMGDLAAARQSAARALELARPVAYQMMVGQTKIKVALIYLMDDKVAEAIPLLRQGLEIGLTTPNTALAFTALYYLALLYRSELPPALYERIVKIASISPAMYWHDRPLAQERAHREGIFVSALESAALWATSLKTVQALVDEAMTYLPRWML